MTVRLLRLLPRRPQLSDTLRQYSDRFDCVVSADEGGFVEYWRPSEQFELPTNVSGLWSFKTQTDLYEFKKVSPRRSVLRAHPHFVDHSP